MMLVGDQPQSYPSYRDIAERAANDLRTKELYLTKAGEKRLRIAKKGWSEAQAQFETTFGPKRAADLRSMLRAVAATEFH